MKLNSLLIFLFFLQFFACKTDDSSLGFEPGPPGSYSYSAFDSLGSLIVGGWFILDFVDSTKFEGTWRTESFVDRTDIGPQVGEGKLVGEIYNSSISIELNPQFADNNLNLNGKWNENEFQGTWAWLTYIGASNWGTFKAVKN